MQNFNKNIKIEQYLKIKLKKKNGILIFYINIEFLNGII